MSTYRGTRHDDVQLVEVTKDDQLLSPLRSLRIRNHSPTGFEWGYGGSGPAQLALALLLEELPEADARRLYQVFKRAVVANFDRAGWECSSDFIHAWAAERMQSEEAVEAVKVEE